MGVEIFFVISGFVIAFSAHAATARSFLRGRVLRLVPGAWVCATVTLIVAAIVGEYSVPDLIGYWLRAVLFSPYGGYIDTVYWTLAIEISFYLLFLALIFFRLSAQIDRVFLALAAISTGFLVTVFIVRTDLHLLAHARTAQLLLLVNGGEFAVGVFLWRLLNLGVTPMRLTGLALGLVGGGLETAKFVTQAHDRVFALALWLFAIGCIVLSVRVNERLGKALGARGRGWVRAAGLATYPLYLLHQTNGAAVMRVAGELGLPQVACLLLAIATMLAAALVVALWLEPALKARLARLFTPRAPGVVPVLPEPAPIARALRSEHRPGG